MCVSHLQKSFDTEAFSSLQIDPSNLRHKLNTHLHKSSIYIYIYEVHKEEKCFGKIQWWTKHSTEILDISNL